MSNSCNAVVCDVLHAIHNHIKFNLDQRRTYCLTPLRSSQTSTTKGHQNWYESKADIKIPVETGNALSPLNTATINNSIMGMSWSSACIKQQTEGNISAWQTRDTALQAIQVFVVVFPCLSNAIISLRLVILQRRSTPHSVSDYIHLTTEFELDQIQIC